MKYKIILLLAFLHLKNPGYGQNVGIGVENPVQKLHVNGAVKIGSTNTNDSGTIRWNSVKNDFEGYVGDRWLSFTGGRSQWGNTEQYATESYGVVADFARDTLFGELISHANEKLAISIPKAENGIYKNSGTVRIHTLNSSGQPGYRHNLYPPVYSDNSFFGKGVDLNKSILYNELVVGEPGATADGNLQQGKAYVYKLNANTGEPGTPQALLQTGVAGDPFDKFGSTVAINGDFIAVAATEKSVNGNSKQGRVYMYKRIYILNQPTDAFTFDATITPADGTAQMMFGSAISLQPGCMAIAAPNATVNGAANAGKVYIYRRINNTWQLEATLPNPTGNAGQVFGKSISINQAGDTLAIGAPDYLFSPGKAYLYVKNNNSWTYSTQFSQGTIQRADAFGCAVDFLNGKLLVGVKEANVGINYQQGKAILYTRSGGGWHREALFTAQNGEANLLFGSSVQLTPNMAIISAPGYTNTQFRAEKGKVFWFLNQ
ncbi:MAG: hypothetical protein JNK91_06355 [Ferruginibacter sp.]|nr:hypothetical protein [Ferruginibacter sp.]